MVMKYAGEPIDLKKITIAHMIQICQTVNDYIHGYNLVHNDLKPNNIVILDDKITIIDFESVCNNESSSNRFSSGYVAPERVSERQSTFKSDVFSIGMTIAQHVCNLCKPCIAIYFYAIVFSGLLSQN